MNIYFFYRKERFYCSLSLVHARIFSLNLVAHQAEIICSISSLYAMIENQLQVQGSCYLFGRHPRPAFD